MAFPASRSFLVYSVPVMKILVPTKRVPDTDQKIVASADGTHIEDDHLPFVINPFDAMES